MKTIGLLGGSGWVSTVEYYRLINQKINDKLGGLHAARLILYSMNMHEMIQIGQHGKNPEAMKNYLLSLALKIANMGAELLLLCANTLHIYADAIQQEIKIPLIHIADATASVVKSQNISKVGLLGTQLTMEKDFYKNRLAINGLEVIVPESEQRKYIMETIFNQLERGIFHEKTRQQYLQIIQQLHQSGAEGIILGCTEIPLLIKQHHTSVPLFDTTEIHAQAAVDFALK